MRTLTQEERERIRRNKEEALRRKREREGRKCQSPSKSPRITRAVPHPVPHRASLSHHPTVIKSESCAFSYSSNQPKTHTCEGVGLKVSQSSDVPLHFVSSTTESSCPDQTTPKLTFTAFSVTNKVATGRETKTEDEFPRRRGRQQSKWAQPTAQGGSTWGLFKQGSRERRLDPRVQGMVNTVSARVKAEKEPSQITEAMLNEDQKLVRDIILSGQNVLITGNAGTGKTFLLRCVLSRLRSSDTVVTASTGIAAVAVGGRTVHSFAGIRFGNSDKERLADEVKKNKRARQRWMFARVLVIDEISMISGELFDKLEYIARVIRGSGEPFGGLQLVLCGDFLQLPPVAKGGEHVSFCFQASSWDSCRIKVANLTKVFRQRDSAFVDVLNELRMGVCSEKSVEVLQKCVSDTHERAKASSDLSGVEALRPTVLYPHNVDVNAENNEEMRRLPGEPRLFVARDFGSEVDLIKNCQAVARLELKVGAQVMFLKNKPDSGIVNGSRGVVVSFDLPPKANTVQGQADPMVMYPIVQFRSGERHLVSPETWEVESGGKVVASRVQVPLKLAWALSIHKSQGMTLDRVRLSLRNVFEYGQAYVALSRVTDLSGLDLLDFDPVVVQAFPDVVHYYNSLPKLSGSARGETDSAASGGGGGNDYVGGGVSSGSGGSTSSGGLCIKVEREGAVENTDHSAHVPCATDRPGGASADTGFGGNDCDMDDDNNNDNGDGNGVADDDDDDDDVHDVGRI
eukprot:Rmarinus@m.23237